MSKTKQMLEDFPINEDAIRQMEIDKDYESYITAKGLKTHIISNDMEKIKVTIDLSKYTGYSPLEEESTTMLISGTRNIVITTPYHIVDYLWKKVH